MTLLTCTLHFKLKLKPTLNGTPICTLIKRDLRLQGLNYTVELRELRDSGIRKGQYL